MTAFLEFKNISKRFPGVRALHELSFAVPAGRVIGLLGENGAGKSTLIKILGGDYVPDSGEILIAGEPRRFGSTRASIAAGVTVVHQELQLVPELTVAENLMLGRFPSRLGLVNYRELFAQVGRVLSDIGVDVDPRARVVDLSIGARQMVEIAKAAIFDASVIALDEPTSSLSAHESEILFRLVDRLRKAGKSDGFAVFNAAQDHILAAAKADIDLDLRIDPSLIGGLIVKMGSRMVDASLKTKLNGIRLAMRAAR